MRRATEFTDAFTLGTRRNRVRRASSAAWRCWGCGDWPPDRAVEWAVFVGVCARDAASAPEARALGSRLAALGWPTRVDDQPVGHGVSDIHMAHALAWLRGGRAR